ncbi:hypothetical protein QAD02_012209 [Eretmocerus hayati]|uniref:Uncharacterized protein n=1 Tax=Eretmocerus hayati TaxID=131215 RepID=A0ACC2P1U4_9HYME|nr:hypothetical protein QAD02_012209 [Eretmocerus hayati]
MGPNPDQQRPDGAGTSSSSPTTSTEPCGGTNAQPSSPSAGEVALGIEPGLPSNEETLQSLDNAALVDSKQEEAATLSALNEGELRALLDEAITYKCPKDREGKSSLFKELLQEAEADEGEESRWSALRNGFGGAGSTSSSSSTTSSRCFSRSSSTTGTTVSSGTARRSSRRSGEYYYYNQSSLSEHPTHGGSLQNLALREDADGFVVGGGGPSGSGGSHYYGGARRRHLQHQQQPHHHQQHQRNRRHGQQHYATSSSVSERQREGGSLPTNVNVTHTLAPTSAADLKKGLSEGKSAYDWTNKEKSKSLDKPSYSKKEDVEKDRKDNRPSSSCDIESESRDKRNSNKGKPVTNEMLDSDNPPPEYNKQGCIVLGLEDLEASIISERNASAALRGVPRPRSLDAEDDEGTEMKVIDHRRPVQFITHATFDIPRTSVDSGIEFPTFREHTTKLEKSKINVNGTEGTSSLPFSPYNNVKCVMSGPSNVYSVMSWQSSNISMVSRLTAQHIVGKESSLSGEKKSLDENGNAVQGFNGERKKNRRKIAQEPNVIVYKAENVKGHRDDDDIDSLINFIENKECKSKKGKATNNVKVKTSNPKSRSRDNKDIKREQISSKILKSNSLEEISKTKLEDLTSEKNRVSSSSSSVSSQHGSINVTLRRAKQRSTGDATAIDSRGDRRSWGTEEGQSIYCNDIGDGYNSRRDSVKKGNAEHEAETEFHVVTSKKKKTKKQLRSSSGGRAQNLSGSGSYPQRGRGFSNNHRAPLSPEIRRKSASSMPPSDKSDSSDLDSVHSLPVTSNSSKHNSSKDGSSGSAPQASYADIARMASLNVSTTPMLNISNLMPSMTNPTESWPTVNAKSSNSSAGEKLTSEYYPSLDELQHSEGRRSRQHNFATQGASASLDKPASPTPSKSKVESNGSSNKKTDELAISKVTKYVQDIEKMQQNQHQESACNDSSPTLNEATPPNPVSADAHSSIQSSSLPEVESNAESCNSSTNGNSSKESSVVTSNPRSTNSMRVRKTQFPTVQSSDEFFRDSKKEETGPKVAASSSNPTQFDDTNKPEPRRKISTAGPSESIIVDSSKPRPSGAIKSSAQQSRAPSDSDTIVRVTKTDRLPKGSKDQQHTHHRDNSKVPKCQQEKPEDHENKKSKQSSSKVDKDTKVTDVQSTEKTSAQVTGAATTTAIPRPAVILLDETISDQSKTTESDSSELTFGFEVNEQLLQSEDEEDGKAPTVVPDVSRFSNSPPNFSCQPPPPMFDKHIRVDKYPPNFPINSYISVHPTMGTPVLVQTTYLGCPIRFQTPYLLPQHPAPPPMIEKCRNQPNEDFSSRYIAPDESHVQKFNHDKIVSFVGLAWDDVMRETGSASSGRVQYYSGQ